MKPLYALGALSAVIINAACMADDLTAAKAEALLQPFMTNDCGSYYSDTDQDEPDFANLNGKALCVYKPRVTHIEMETNSAMVEYNHDRHFGNDVTNVWLDDYAKMAAHEAPSLLYKALKNNLEKWKTNSAGVDSGDRPGKATFKLGASGWQVDSAPQD